MRKILLNNLGIALILGSLTWGSSVYGESISALLVFKNPDQTPSVFQKLKTAGVQIKEAAIPNLAVVQFPDHFDPSILDPWAHWYVGPLSKAEATVGDPLSLALLERWNREVKPSGNAQTSSIGALRTVTDATFVPQAQIKTGATNGRIFSIEMEPNLTADIFEIQIANEATFQNPITGSLQAAPEGSIPIPLEINQSFYARARILQKDRRDNGELYLLSGAWSEPKAVSYSAQPHGAASAPSLVSPLQGQEMEGFTVILEWASDEEEFRVQLSETASFDVPLIDSHAQSRAFPVPALALEENKTYFWRVAVWEENKISPWSETRPLSILPPRTIGSDMFVNPEAPQ